VRWKGGGRGGRLLRALLLVREEVLEGEDGEPEQAAPQDEAEWAGGAGAAEPGVLLPAAHVRARVLKQLNTQPNTA